MLMGLVVRPSGLALYNAGRDISRIETFVLTTSFHNSYQSALGPGTCRIAAHMDPSNISHGNDPDELVSMHLRLLNQANAGQLDELQCPKCRLLTVSAWFSRPAEDVYRTWFLCANCDFHARAQNSAKPTSSQRLVGEST